MGMSASQARLLSLQARQSNLEYQGQQINQARTVLSQQATALYNSLLSMTVPTPPSTTDFQTIEYSGTMGASTFTLGTITPEESGDTYNVEIKYEKNGAAVKGGSYMSVGSYAESSTITVSPVSVDPVKTVSVIQRGDELQSDELSNYSNSTNVMHYVTGPQSGVNKYYYYDTTGKGFVETSSYNDAKSNASDGTVYISTTIGALNKNDYDWNSDDTIDYVYDPNKTSEYTTGGITEAEFLNGTYYDANGNVLTIDKLNKAGKDANGNTLYNLSGAYKKDPYGSSEIPNVNYNANEANKGTTVGGNQVYDITKEKLGSQYDGAMLAIANSYPEYKNADGTPNAEAIAKDFQVFFQTNDANTNVPYFVRREQVFQQGQIASGTGQGQVEVFSLEANGTYTDAVQTENCKLQFDTSGRISSIGIPLKGEDGNYLIDDNGEIRYNFIDLEAATVTDEDAYKDAYAEYEYETYLYDQKNKEINAKTEIIQQEDRNLELKLQRLDNERTQITTEIEAVEKVINDNIEASYKSFSG